MREFWREFGATRTTTIIVGAFFIIVAIFIIAWFLPMGSISYSALGLSDMASTTDATAAALNASSTRAVMASSTPPAFVVTHITTPTPLKGIYMTSWAAGSKKFRTHLFDLVDTTEINAVVIDVKDYTGHISFMVEDPELVKIGASEKRIPDIKEFIGRLHEKGVYVIGRISVFQDSYMMTVHPEWAVKTKSGAIWQDYKGVKWLDAAAKPVWEYVARIGREAYSVGFDELNFDYIRFPSDGNLEDISYTWAEGRQRSEIVKDFYSYMHDQFSGSGIPTSADLFGLTTSAEGDLGIGQILEYALDSFDYVAPMVYPSHFGAGFDGYTKPAQYPYEIIHSSMSAAIRKAQSTTTRSTLLAEEPIASTSPQLYTKKTYDIQKLRPWLQAFDLGAIYTPEMVRKQIKATYDVGLTSWMLWNAASVYQKEALLGK
jgi:hypothetical protein